MSATIRVRLSLDPETRRVHAQARDWSEADFPRGLRGAGWPRRELEVDLQTWQQVLASDPTCPNTDLLHRGWWDAAGAPGDPKWPLLAGEEPQ
jgi:hypothetical protein